jgi:hypothetical protein
MCLILDLRRVNTMARNDAVKELLGKLEPVGAELDDELFPALATQSARVKDDPLVAPQVRRMVGDMAENFKRIRGAYASKKNVDDRQLRPWKQTHKRLLTDLSKTLKLEVPDGLMLAFDDHTPAQPSIVLMGPQNLGSLSGRLRQRSQAGAPGSSRQPPGRINRPPSLRDRMGPRTGIR